jgi:hypothetical protein
LITYAELSAFVRVANQAVRNDKYRPDILARAPGNGDDVLIDLRDAVAGRVRFAAEMAGRQVLEDGLGIRWADVHPGPRQHLTLALPAEPWGGGVLFVESLADDTEYRVNKGSVIDLARVAPRPRELLSRGALNEAFALLFTLPFDISALTAPPESDATVAPAGGLNVRIDGPSKGPTARSTAGMALAGASVTAFAAAAGIAWSAASLRHDAQNEDGAQRAALNDELGRRNLWTMGVLAGGALLAAAAATLLVLNRRVRE